jgi:magnesium-transporting ATPase (P-type)
MKQNDYTGLTDAQVLESRKKHGENILTPPEKDSLWKRFFEKLTGPFGHHIKGWEDGDELIFILEIAALLSILISFSEYYGWLGADSTAEKIVFLREYIDDPKRLEEIAKDLEITNDEWENIRKNEYWDIDISNEKDLRKKYKSEE